MSETIAVLGAGNMGTAVAQVLASNGHAVRAWSIETDVLEEIRDRRANTKYLAGVELHSGIDAVSDLEKAVTGAGLIVLSVPSQIVARMARDLNGALRQDQLVLNVAKGLESGTDTRLSDVIVRELGETFRPSVGGMGGPAIAIEMARGQPTAVIVGFKGENYARQVQSLLQNEWVKVDVTSDLVGLELSSTLKNVFAIALGICDGLGLGANTKAFVGTLAIEEMSRICQALGGRAETVYGLAGLGDLLTTGYSLYSRNRTLGELLGGGGDWRTFMREKTVEGVPACEAVSELCSKSPKLEEGQPLHLLYALNAILCREYPAEEGMWAFLREFAYS